MYREAVCSWHQHDAPPWSGKGPEVVVSLQEKGLGRAASVEEKKRWLDNDYKALSALYQNGSTWPDASDLLASITAPFLLNADESDTYYDGAREAVKHIQHASFVSIPGLMHTEAFVRSDLILPHAKRFLRSVL